ncbi:cbb3-type cytochrome oxidase assembly protein CcoS [Vibrio sp. V27_P1S3P104]|nr:MULTISPECIES: cbb3-type cytochrome oxidase assembly protein CcoS [unclassified Vibrio]NAW67948.1 cbb3-type cytochrome oxidase assembly protein CcoS [Vibrio sp. V28_P6S34P95]NAX04720.1 cbb3-type cytochrome oxidase assembly protein CcoS [Vibrio sp. V30_P3S12P165]NAX33492.1 cbb3-type cytochrome oxidase assembly protein CcoS [Vibrio sp. V29_P1S30P107]NAX36992.1 cbb3-type cytochrome oxidase assembly protein CcoS [Vibrio sp. V27_P1S3P104]NAX40564.1 cbb3-type cytochrome oxidase assembly protein Cc
MDSFFLLVPAAILFTALACAIFIWAVKHDQFEDLERQGHNILFDDEEPKQEETDACKSQYRLEPEEKEGK